MKILHGSEDQKTIQEILSKAELVSLVNPICPDALIEEVCSSAVKYKIGNVVALPETGRTVAKRLKNSGVNTVCLIELISGVAGIAEGRKITIQKLLDAGIREFDVTINWAKFAEKDIDAVKNEIAEYADFVHKQGGVFGVPIEVGTMCESNQLIVSKLAAEAGADSLKTSSGTCCVSGIDPGRATIHNVCLLNENFGKKMKIKAGGGTDFAYLEDVWEYIQAGADRVDIGKRILNQLETLNYKA